MSESKFPDVNDPATAPFWNGTRQGKITVQACTHCGYLRWPPSPFCTECLSTETEWKEISPTGTLWSYATYRKPMSPEYAKDVPYTVALVELDDGPRIYGRLVEGSTKIEPGLPVRAVFQEIEPGVTFIKWQIDGNARRTAR